MKNQYHILNGDALKRQFPQTISGEIIVTRECLIDGDVKGANLTEFFHSRATFINSHFQGHTAEDYHENVVLELLKIQKIPDGSEINLWFEDDLFCQVNMWFVCSLLMDSGENNEIFLVRPGARSRYAFGALDTSELVSVFEERVVLKELKMLASLWKFYQEKNVKELVKTGEALGDIYPFVLPAVKAHIERIPTEGNPGRPINALIQIMKDLKTHDFQPVFREFCKREGIYGFGDTQVMSLLAAIKKQN